MMLPSFMVRQNEFEEGSSRAGSSAG